MRQDVLGRASAMLALHPIHPIDRHLYRRVYRAGTDSWPWGNAQEPSARRIEGDQATRSHFDDAYRSKMLHYGIVRLREDWLDMGCVARKCDERSHLPQEMFKTHLLQERIDKLVFLSQLRKEVLALTKG
jgi:hypothetical protein